MPVRLSSKVLLLAAVALVLAGLPALSTAAPAPALPPERPAQATTLGPGWMCVTRLESIPRGSSEAIEVDLEVGDAPTGDTTGRICQPVDIIETMGVGIAGLSSASFQTDPSDMRIRDRINTELPTNFTWIVNATGAELSSHNVIVYAFVDDPDRSTGFRSVARVPLRITIGAAPKNFGEQVLAFISSTKEILLALGALLTALVAFRGQIKKLFERNPPAAN